MQILAKKAFIFFKDLSKNAINCKNIAKSEHIRNDTKKQLTPCLKRTYEYYRPFRGPYLGYNPPPVKTAGFLPFTA